jgi:hypothetical protein
MNQHKTNVPVLARFPDLNDGTANAKHNKTPGFGLLASSGRLFGQTLSIKLLAGTALFLLVGAVLPFCIGKNPPPADSSPTGDSAVTAQSKLANATPEAAPVADEAVALTASRLPVRVIAAKEPSLAPAALPPSSETTNKPQPGPATDVPVMSSRWPSAAPTDLQPTSVGGEAPRAGVFGPAATRPTEYEADAGSTPGTNREIRR